MPPEQRKRARLPASTTLVHHCTALQLPGSASPGGGIYPATLFPCVAAALGGGIGIGIFSFSVLLHIFSTEAPSTSSVVSVVCTG